VISRQAADSVTSVLTGVVDDGTARVSVRDAPGRGGQQVAGKTGTSDNNKSAWFTGYTPKLVTSVGLFGEAAESHKGADGKLIRKGAQVTLKGAAGGGRVNGGGFPAEIWADYTFQVMGGRSTFDLDTDMGAAVTPPPSSTSPSPSGQPSESASPSDQPSSEAPSSEPPADSPPPSTPSDPTPSGGTSSGPPTVPDPTDSAEVPLKPADGRQNSGVQG
jgi:membrane peptidoglycan carboxypeptidase